MTAVSYPKTNDSADNEQQECLNRFAGAAAAMHAAAAFGARYVLFLFIHSDASSSISPIKRRPAKYLSHLTGRRTMEKADLCGL
jgi:hypothetical protein